MPDASVSVPEISGSLPEVSGDAAVPSVGGGLGVDVAVPSAEVDASFPSASGDLPGKCKGLGLRFLAVCFGTLCRALGRVGMFEAGRTAHSLDFR